MLRSVYTKVEHRKLEFTQLRYFESAYSLGISVALCLYMTIQARLHGAMQLRVRARRAKPEGEKGKARGSEATAGLGKVAFAARCACTLLRTMGVSWDR